MFESSSWKHLRIPFSYYLMPIFWFGLALSPDGSMRNIILVWMALHLFLYPSSNGYNSYFDKDGESIGGLKNPPKVSLGLYYLSLLFFALALGLALLINVPFFSMVLIYGLVSMAYSHPTIRLKKYAYTSWMTAGFFQGCFTLIMCYVGLNGSGWDVWTQLEVLVPGLLTSLLLLGSYPLTQIYQHQEDGRRGDRTLSLKLGVMGTFNFSSIWFLIAGLGYAKYFFDKNQDWAFWAFLMAMLPVVLYFFFWWMLAKKNEKEYVNHTMAMWMNKISGTALNLFFLYYTYQLHLL
ncbi:MAG: UbiA family prenyltransferase [Cyclobacteriaceae bacterium]